MIDLLHSFLIGLAFAAGVGLGAVLVGYATRASSKIDVAFRDKVESRLSRQADAMERLNEQIDYIIDYKINNR